MRGPLERVEGEPARLRVRPRQEQPHVDERARVGVGGGVEEQGRGGGAGDAAGARFRGRGRRRRRAFRCFFKPSAPPGDARRRGAELPPVDGAVEVVVDLPDRVFRRRRVEAVADERRRGGERRWRDDALVVFSSFDVDVVDVVIVVVSVVVARGVFLRAAERVERPPELLELDPLCVACLLGVGESEKKKT